MNIRKPGAFAGDTDRANIGRRHRTPPGGASIPTEVDPEMTPPPQPIPSPEQLDGFYQLEPQVQEQLKLLAGGLDRVRDAVGQMWGSRKDGERLDKIEQKLDVSAGYNKEHGTMLHEFVLPGIKGLMGRLDILLTSHETGKVRTELFWSDQWPSAVESLKAITERLGRVERMQEDQGRDIRDLSRQISIVTSTTLTLDQRVTSLERLHSDGVLTLTTRGARDKWWIAGLSVVGGALVAVAKYAYEHFSK